MQRNNRALAEAHIDAASKLTNHVDHSPLHQAQQTAILKAILLTLGDIADLLENPKGE